MSERSEDNSTLSAKYSPRLSELCNSGNYAIFVLFQTVLVRFCSATRFPTGYPFWKTQKRVTSARTITNIIVLKINDLSAI